MNTRLSAPLVAVVVLVACGRTEPLATLRAETSENGIFASMTELPAPAGPGSAQPHLDIGSDGRVFLSWIESQGGRATFRFAERLPAGWSTPRTIAEGRDFFVNWADVPSIVVLEGGRLVAHWLQKSGPDTYSYDVKLKVSDDNGKTWVGPLTPHRDGTPTEHGFASLIDWPDFALRASSGPADQPTPRLRRSAEASAKAEALREGGPGGSAGTLGLVWLDGRKMVGHGGHGDEMKGEMTLRSTTLSGRELGPEMLIDDRVCECCPTAAVRTARGALVAYRDRSEQEVRDISVARYENGAWTAPVPVHRDNWTIPGCPVNGPALAADGNRVAIAWFTAANAEARVNVAFSTDGGATFSAPVRADDGAPIGRVDVELLPDGAALVTWIEHNDGKSELRTRQVPAHGARSDSIRVAAITSERASGYPRMVRSGNTIVFAWTATEGKGRQLKTVVATLR